MSFIKSSNKLVSFQSEELFLKMLSVIDLGGRCKKLAYASLPFSAGFSALDSLEDGLEDAAISSRGSSGAGGGVVAMVQPIHAIIPIIATTAAVITIP